MSLYEQAFLKSGRAALLGVAVALIAVAPTSRPTPAALAASSPTYAQAVLASSPSLYWRMDDPATTLADASGNGRGGSITGAATTGVTGAMPADPDAAVRFDGTSAYAEGAILAVGADFTSEMWVKGAAGATGQQVLFSVFDGDTQNPARDVLVDYTWGQVRARLDATSGWAQRSLAAPADPTQWHHVAFTVAGNQDLRLYVDGVPADSRTLAAPDRTFAAPVRVAWSRATWEQKLSGTVDEVAVYPVDLVPCEHHLEHVRFEPGSHPNGVDELAQRPAVGLRQLDQHAVEQHLPGNGSGGDADRVSPVVSASG